MIEIDTYVKPYIFDGRQTLSPYTESWDIWLELIVQKKILYLQHLSLI